MTFTIPGSRCLVPLLSCLLVSACSTWSSGEVTNVRPTAEAVAQVLPGKVILRDGDIPDRRYEAVGDLSVTVNKTTIFHDDPTREMVDEKLREEAAKLGADAVIHVRYGTVGISLMSWGSLDGKGRAVRFVR